MAKARATTAVGVTRAYARISLDSERSGSIAKQKDRLSASEVMAGRDPDAIVWYVDESVSGSRDVKRPGRDLLIAEVRKGDRVVVTKIDRLARNVRDLLDLVSHVEQTGASIRFIDNDINTEGPYGRFTLTLLAAIAELEAGIISERRKESLESFAKEGRHAVGKAPFGFVSVPNPSGRGLVIAPDPKKAPLVRKAVKRILAGESQNTVRQSLGLSSTGFNKLLRNPRLAGMTPRNGGVVMIDGIPVFNPDAAILSLPEWNALQERVGSGDKSWTKAEGFGAALYCSVCGDRLYLNKSQRKVEYATYRCINRSHPAHTAGGPKPSVIAGNADARVESEFLGRFGRWHYSEVVVVDEDAAKTEALSLAKVRIEELVRRLANEDDDAEAERLTAELSKARQQRRDAEAMPTERVIRRVPMGKTYAEVWATASQAERERMVLEFGRFEVQPGRNLPIEEKVIFVSKSGPKGAPGVSLGDMVGMIHYPEPGETSAETQPRRQRNSARSNGASRIRQARTKPGSA